MRVREREAPPRASRPADPYRLEAAIRKAWRAEGYIDPPPDAAALAVDAVLQFLFDDD